MAESAMLEKNCFHLRMFTLAGASLLCFLLIAFRATTLSAQDDVKTLGGEGPPIVVPSRPRDSRGEIVYKNQGSDEKDQPAVPGTLVQPVPIKLPGAKYPKSLKRARAGGDVTVEGVITQNGELIDGSVVNTVDVDSAKSALNAVARYRFKPATLDGRPVAILVRVIVHFRIW